MFYCESFFGCVSLAYLVLQACHHPLHLPMALLPMTIPSEPETSHMVSSDSNSETSMGTSHQAESNEDSDHGDVRTDDADMEDEDVFVLIQLG